MTLAFLCPGQGSQVVGMGKALAGDYTEARLVFDEVDDVLGQKLSHLMFEGPEDQLTLTSNAQPALMASSVAVMRVLEKRFGDALWSTCGYVAGHSLGEYAALTLAGSLSLADSARLLRIRGDAMQAAVPVGQGAMAALLGLDYDDVVAIAREAAQGEICNAANDNAPGQVVVSGHVNAVQRAMELAKAKGAKRALLLPVSAPFHCALMQPAADAMRAALDNVTLHQPRVPVICNVTAQQETDPVALKANLVDQVVGTVRWRESIASLAADKGVQRFVEVGTGKVLAGLVKRIATDVEVISVSQTADFDSLASFLG